MAYISMYELKKNVTDYQLSLLICLQEGSDIVTNEGAYFRAWLETDGVENKKVSVRKDVADNMLSIGLIESKDGRSSRLFYYGLSKKAKELLPMIDAHRLMRIKNKLISKGAFEQKESETK